MEMVKSLGMTLIYLPHANKRVWKTDILAKYIILLKYRHYYSYIGVYSFCLFYNNVCVSVIFFSSKISQEVLDQILKFCTNIGYDKLKCVLKNRQYCISVFLFVHLSFSPIHGFHHISSASMSTRVFQNLNTR